MGDGRAVSLAAKGNGGRSVGEAAQRERKHVFVINGHPDFLNLMRDLFQDERYNVTTTNFVPESFDMVAALQPAVIILDVNVAQREGWTLLEHLHAEAATNEIPVLVVSTDRHLLERARAQAERYGAVDVLSKPFDLDAMVEAVRGLVGGA